MSFFNFKDLDGSVFMWDLIETKGEIFEENFENSSFHLTEQ
jgi:hypothetical protein